MSPTLAAFLFRELGILFWNLYASAFPEFPFIEGWSLPLTPSLEALERYIELAIYIWRDEEGLQEPPWEIHPPVQKEEQPWITLVRMYVRDSKNKRNTESLPSNDFFPLYEMTCSLSSSSTSEEKWKPLRLSEDVPPQNYLTPFFFKNENWFTEDDWRYMYSIGEQYIPKNSVEEKKEIDKVIAISEHLTDEQKIIAEFWSGSESKRCTPPSQWMLFAILIVQQLALDLPESILFLSLTSICLYHAAIAAWALKYKYRQARPIQKIRQMYPHKWMHSWIQKGKRIQGCEWMPFQRDDFVTPPFPDFVSGHSTFSMACATVFARLLQSDTLCCVCHEPILPSTFQRLSSLCDGQTMPCLFSHITIAKHMSHIESNDLPVTMEWSTWSQMAREAGLSRIYGGIHYPSSNIAGGVVGEWVTHTLLDKRLPAVWKTHWEAAFLKQK